jgi:hypothetical protein
VVVLVEVVELDVDQVEVVELDADLDPVVVVQEDLVLHTLVHSVKVIAAVVVSVDLLVLVEDREVEEWEVVNGVDRVENLGLDTVVKYYLNKSC